MIRIIASRLRGRSRRAWLLPLLPLATATAFAGMALTAYDSGPYSPDSHILLSPYDLIDFYEDMVDFHLPIATPAPYDPMSISGNPSALVLDPDSPGWPTDFLKRLVPEESYGVVTYPIYVEQDDEYRYILNADFEILTAVPLAKVYDRYAFLRQRHPEVFTQRTLDERAEWLLGVYDPQRMVMRVTLMTPEGFAAWTEAVEEERDKAWLARQQSAPLLMQVLDFSVTSWQLDGADFRLGWNPDAQGNFHAVERSLDLMGSLWTPVYWAQGATNWTHAASTNDAEYAFYRVVEFDATAAGTDASGSGLTAFQEYLLGTDPTKRDTSGGGIPDGAVVLAGGNPLHNALNDTALTLTYAYDEHDRLVTVFSATHTLTLTHDDTDNVSTLSVYGGGQ